MTEFWTMLNYRKGTEGAFLSENKFVQVSNKRKASRTNSIPPAYYSILSLKFLGRRLYTFRQKLFPHEKQIRAANVLIIHSVTSDNDHKQQTRSRLCSMQSTLSALDRIVKRDTAKTCIKSSSQLDFCHKFCRLIFSHLSRSHVNPRLVICQTRIYEWNRGNETRHFKNIIPTDFVLKRRINCLVNKKQTKSSLLRWLWWMTFWMPNYTNIRNSQEISI